MTDNTRVVTAKLSADLVSRIDEIASRIDRTKSWIVRQAVSEWLVEEQRRHEFTIEALREVDEERVIAHEKIEEQFAQEART